MSKIIVFAKCVKHQLYHPRRRAMKPKRKTCVLLCGLIVLCSLSGCAVLPSISYSHCFVINTFINMRRRLRRRRPQELNELILQLGFDVFESHAEKGRSMNLVRYFCPHLGRAGPVFTILDSDPLLVVKHIYIFWRPSLVVESRLPQVPGAECRISLKIYIQTYAACGVFASFFFSQGLIIKTKGENTKSQSAHTQTMSAIVENNGIWQGVTFMGDI